MKKILLIGKNGQVGWELMRTLAPLGPVTGLDRLRMDLANPDSIRKAVRETNPEVIINAAAYTAVDKAESELDAAMTINGVAPGILAEETKRLNALLVHFSTDYMFDGRKPEAYSEVDEPNPLNVYGKTKLEGERAIQAAGTSHLIFRTSWVYGARGKNFLLTMLRLAKDRDELRVVNDQFGAPTWSRLIAEVVAQALAACLREPTNISGLSGIYHLASAGETSWYGFANEIFQQRAIYENALTKEPSAKTLHILPISSASYRSPTIRPANSRLNCAKTMETFDISLPDWRDSLRLCLEELYSRG